MQTLIELSKLIELLEQAAAKQGAVIYNICNRKVGWGIMWHETFRESGSAFVVYQYHPTFQEAIIWELNRLGVGEQINVISFPEGGTLEIHQNKPGAK